MGLDPTAPDIHLGHTVVLNKMRQLQDLGHTVIFLIGDFTSMIGDPSGRNSTRPPLTAEQIKVNAETYYRQASLVLDPAKTEIRYNSEWSDPLGARHDPAGQPLHRGAHDGAQRLPPALYTGWHTDCVHEFYPLMQGYDSVALHSDLELGGTDQKFNLLMGRHAAGRIRPGTAVHPDHAAAGRPDGVEKMSKSKNNYIGISEDPNTMFAKVLSISDVLMWKWYTPELSEPEEAIAALKAEVEGGRNPKDAKVALAKEITARFHSAAAADAAEQDFINRSKGGIPDEIPNSACRWAGAPGHRQPAEDGQPGGLQRRGQPPDRRRRRARGQRGDFSDKGLKLALAPMCCKSSASSARHAGLIAIHSIWRFTGQPVFTD